MLKIIFITLQYCGLKHFGEFGESMKSWLCQNPEQRAVNNVVVDAYKKILKWKRRFRIEEKMYTRRFWIEIYWQKYYLTFWCTEEDTNSYQLIIMPIGQSRKFVTNASKWHNLMANIGTNVTGRSSPQFEVVLQGGWEKYDLLHICDVYLVLAQLICIWFFICQHTKKKDIAG